MKRTHPNFYPPYTRSERVADASMHALGVLAAPIGALALCASTSARGNEQEITAILVYSFAMIMAFTASAAYHFTPIERFRPFLRRCDHACIFLKIAGTYTPLVVLIGSGFSYGVLAVVWAIAIGGMIWKLFFWSTPNWRSTMLYLSLGWMAVALAYPLFNTMPLASVLLIIAGGVTYTIGVIFYRWDDLKYSVAIWHAFVLVASACIYTAIFIGETAKAI